MCSDNQELRDENVYLKYSHLYSLTENYLTAWLCNVYIWNWFSHCHEHVLSDVTGDIFFLLLPPVSLFRFLFLDDIRNSPSANPTTTQKCPKNIFFFDLKHFKIVELENPRQLTRGHN